MTDAGDTKSAFDALSDKHQLFVLSYLANPNATQAAIAAGYAKVSASVTGHRLIRDHRISNALREQKAAQFQRLHMDADELLALIANQARGMMGEVLHVTDEGDPYIDLNKASPQFLSNVVEAVVEDFTDGRDVDGEGNTIKREVRRVKVKLASPDSARNTLAKHLGLLIDRVEVKADSSFADVMAAAMARAKGGK